LIGISDGVEDDSIIISRTVSVIKTISESKIVGRRTPEGIIKRVTPTEADTPTPTIVPTPAGIICHVKREAWSSPPGVARWQIPTIYRKSGPWINISIQERIVVKSSGIIAPERIVDGTAIVVVVYDDLIVDRLFIIGFIITITAV
jgi:hypothetical protein